MLEFDISHLSYDDALTHFVASVEDFSHIHCTVRFLADHAQSKIIRDMIRITFDKNNIHAPWRGRFALIADELINNAIEHGSQPGDIDTCLIETGKTEDGKFSIVIEVHDTGKGKDSKTAHDMGKVRSEHQTPGVSMRKRGRGLFHITEKLVDRLSFSESPYGGLAVKVEKHIARENLENSTLSI